VGVWGYHLTAENDPDVRKSLIGDYYSGSLGFSCTLSAPLAALMGFAMKDDNEMR
jgi:hypothetical protein